KTSSSRTVNDLDPHHISLNQVDPLLFFGSQVGKDRFAITLGKTPAALYVIAPG
ncbi:hypothetical protein PAXRUDRAFT_128956, partial [Paxillus rubicundulus Ve08.2h10]